MPRPRNAKASRHPGGQVVRAMEDPRSVALVVRARQNALDRAADPMFGTPVGRMFLQREIGPAQYDAAVKLATLREAADRARGLPRRTPAALELGGVKRAGFGIEPDAECDPSECRKTTRVCRCRLQGEIFAAYDAAEAAVTGRGALNALYECVVLMREPAGHEQRLALKDGLEALARHWRLRP